jgi:hypothetical protein
VENIKVNLTATADPTVTDDTAAGYSVGSKWVNVNSDTEFTLVDAANGAAVWKVSTSSLGFFGTGFMTAEDATTSQTTSTTYQQKLRLDTVTSVPAGTYRIGWSFKWTGSSASSEFEGVVDVDDTTIVGDISSKPASANNQQFFSGFHYITFGADGIHTVDIDYRSGSTGKTASIADVFIEFWRVS